ncbi:MAG TPA: LytTR family DNA-binding domain-containing protein [Puia sp.]|jgi:two-component system LytT family response regulator
MIRAIIVEDESLSAEALASLLKDWCPGVKVQGICHSAAEAIDMIERVKPELVFLDIEMPHMNGFELLEKLGEVNFDIIFTTSHDRYAIKAVRISALDYLLKPIDRMELVAAVYKIGLPRRQSTARQLELLLQQLKHPVASRIALPTFEGLQLIALSDIISCTARSNYTILQLKEKQTLTVSRTLKEIEEILEESGFLRIHHSHLVQINEIRKYIRGEGGSVVMSNGVHLDVSKSRKEELLGHLLTRKK